MCATAAKVVHSSVGTPRMMSFLALSFQRPQVTLLRTGFAVFEVVKWKPKAFHDSSAFCQSIWDIKDGLRRK